MSKRKRARGKRLILSAEEEIELLTAAQAGDDAARFELFRRHLPWLESAAAARARGHRNFNDLKQEAIAAFLQSISEWNPERHYRFNTLYRKRVLGALADAAWDLRNRFGFKMESDIQRDIRWHPWLSEEEFRQRHPYLTATEVRWKKQFADDLFRETLSASYSENVSKDFPKDGREARAAESSCGDESKFFGRAYAVGTARKITFLSDDEIAESVVGYERGPISE